VGSAAARAREWLARYYSVLVVLALWEVVARSGLVNPRLFPTLGVIGEQLWAMLRTGAAFKHAGATMLRVLVGFGAAGLLGITLGFLMARVRFLGRLLEPAFSFGYPVPRVALYPVFVFLFGLGHLSKIVLIGLECLYPVAIYTYAASRAVDRTTIWSAQNMGARRVQLFWKVMVPAAAPGIFTGLRIALPIALVIAVVCEMISSTEGLGWLIAYASASLSRGQVFAGVAIIAAIGFALDRLLAGVRNRLIFWERETASIGLP
jgi:NitT/TauT family transport system permease protein